MEPFKEIELEDSPVSQKMVRHQLEDKIVELKEDRSLFARLLIVARSRPEINLQEAIGRYGFSSLPCSMFALNGTLMHIDDSFGIFAKCRHSVLR